MMKPGRDTSYPTEAVPIWRRPRLNPIPHGTVPNSQDREETRRRFITIIKEALALTEDVLKEYPAHEEEEDAE